MMASVELVLDYLEGKTQVCAREIWFEALKENHTTKKIGRHQR